MRNFSRSHLYHPARISDAVTRFTGSYWFIWLHIVWFSLWVGLRVEPFPFGLLTMIVSLEAILLSSLILISQNKQYDTDKRRDDHEAEVVDLLYQINQYQVQILEEIRRHG